MYMHLFHDTHDALNIFIFSIDPVHAENVIREVESLEPALLSQQHDHGTAGPVQPLAKQLSANTRLLSNC